MPPSSRAVRAGPWARNRSSNNVSPRIIPTTGSSPVTAGNEACRAPAWYEACWSQVPTTSTTTRAQVGHAVSTDTTPSSSMRVDRLDQGVVEPEHDAGRDAEHQRPDGTLPPPGHDQRHHDRYRGDSSGDEPLGGRRLVGAVGRIADHHDDGQRHREHDRPRPVDAADPTAGQPRTDGQREQEHRDDQGLDHHQLADAECYCDGDETTGISRHAAEPQGAPDQDQQHPDRTGLIVAEGRRLALLQRSGEGEQERGEQGEGDGEHGARSVGGSTFLDPDTRGGAPTTLPRAQRALSGGAARPRTPVAGRGCTRTGSTQGEPPLVTGFGRIEPEVIPAGGLGDRGSRDRLRPRVRVDPPPGAGVHPPPAGRRRNRSPVGSPRRRGGRVLRCGSAAAASSSVIRARLSSSAASARPWAGATIRSASARASSSIRRAAARAPSRPALVRRRTASASRFAAVTVSSATR